MTPAHIKPVWYFTPFYAMLRVIPAQALGVIVMFAAIVRAVLPAVAGSRRGQVDPLPGLGYKIALGLFALSFVMLGAVGAGVTAEKIPEWFGADANVTTIENAFGRFWLIVYFGFFAFLWSTRISARKRPSRCRSG